MSLQEVGIWTQGYTQGMKGIGEQKDWLFFGKQYLKQPEARGPLAHLFQNLWRTPAL